MFTYADPRVCPSCREPLPQGLAPDHRCRTCDVLLGHPRAAEVFQALERVDTLVGRLRAVSWAPAPVPVGAAAPVPSYAAAPPADPVVPPLAAPPRTGVRTSSVPAILLGLGALCLLVAAVIFLAVAWGWLGVGGRTVVLVALTAATAGGAVVIRVRGLRVSAEALVTVSLGLLVLDVLGAERAGWVGGADGLDGAGLALLVGLALAAAGTLLVVVERRLAVPQVAAVLGLLVAQVALPSTAVGHDLLVAAVATLGFATLAAALHRAATTDLRTALWSAAVAAVLTWCDLTLSALAGVAEGADRGGLTLGELWTSGDGVALLGAALLLLAPLAARRDEALLQVCVTAAAATATGVAVLPVLDNGTTDVGLASVVAGALWTAVAVLAPRRRLAVPTVPAALSLVPGAMLALALVGQALESALTPTGALRLEPGVPVAAPWLLVAVVAAVGALALVVVPAAWRRTVGVRVALPAVLLAAVATLALQPVALWTVVAGLGALAAAYAADGLRRRDTGALAQVLAGSGLLAATVVVAGPSTALTLVPLALLTAVAAATLLLGRVPAATEVGGLLLPPALAGLTWVLGDLAGLDGLRAVPVLGVLAAVALARPQVALEAATGAAAAVAALAAIPLATDETLSLALHLTLLGALVDVHSLVHPSRRRLAYVGTALLVLATWVRLADLGVHAPEPYTLPTALLLVAVGLHRLRRDPSASTATTLLPGLVLATVPSFLQVLATGPFSLRAALLGAASLLLVVGGARLRWSAPLLVGAGVGGSLTLIELAPYAAATPQWVLIGVAGTVLVVVGTTWERRVVELRAAARYVGRLR